MSVISQKDFQCSEIQSELDSQFAICTTPFEAMPFLEAVLATQVAAGISQSVSDGMGKVKTVNVTYDQRALESSATVATGARTCDSTNETYNNYTTYEIDPTTHITYGEKFNVADLATVCQELPAYFAKKIAKVIDVIERKAATQLSNEVVQWVGAWGSNVTADNGSNELVVSTLVTEAGKAVDYSAMPLIDLSLMQTGYCAPPIIVGGSKLYTYGQNIAAGCCATTGVNILDMANQFGKAILYDKRVEAALGSALKSIVFQPGALAVITYNEFNETTLIGANYAKMKVFSPRTGLPIDIIIKDDCGAISITGYFVGKLVGLPNDMFAVGDEYRGVTMVNKILVTNAA